MIKGEAAARYQAEYRKHRYTYGPRRVSNLGTARRLQALSALGWSMSVLAERLGCHVRDVGAWRSGYRPQVTRETAALVDRIYRDLCMTIPPATNGSARARNYAQRRGWFPPLAWDNIDDPDEYPGLGVLAEADAA